MYSEKPTFCNVTSLKLIIQLIYFKEGFVSWKESIPIRRGMAKRFPVPVPDPYTYQTPRQSTFCQPVYDQRSYYYLHDERATAAYKTVTSSYGSYLDSGLPPSHIHIHNQSSKCSLVGF
ncbi:hypothetical protein POM88_044386 [Heracleum sosnowskyi]|uniref:Uncharacterized protein n=1 Tax=Heracleum sosnowskyi TaxID=360622 RepID=A0AAD8M588_9APIA|nr:hypothetical protein POM88_044386 [Heracleum sosnowskyi]